MASNTLEEIRAALKKAGYPVTNDLSPALISEWEKHFIPGVDYTAYFDAVINAAKAEYGDKDPQVSYYVAQKSTWDKWSKDPTNATLTGVDLSNSGGKTYTDLAQQANTVKQTLAEQTKALNDAVKLGTAATTLSLYGTGTADKPAKNSIAANYNAAQTALTKAQAAVAKKDTPNAQAALTKAQTAFNTNKTAFDTAQQIITENAKGGLTPAEKVITDAYDAYLTKAYTPYTNFLSGTVLPAGGTQADATKASVDKALEFYKTNGYMPTVDSAVLGQVQTAISNYEQQKIKDKQLEKAQAVAAASPKEIGQTQKDISNYNALIAQAAKNAPVVADSTADVLKKMNAAKGETTQGMGMPDILKRTGAQAGVTPPSNPPVELTDNAPSINAPQSEWDVWRNTMGLQLDKDIAYGQANKSPSQPLTEKGINNILNHSLSTLSLITDKDGNRLISDELITASIKGDRKSKQQANSPFTGKQRSFTPNDFGYSSAFNSVIGRVLYGDNTPKRLASYLNKIGRPTSLSGIQPATTQPATTQPATTQPATTQPINAGLSSLAGTAQPTQQSQVPQLGLKLSQDFNTRMTQQDLAAQQQLQRPGTYAAGQFDPFYSGYLGVGNNYATQDSPMLPGGIWAGGPQVMTPSKVGFGIQNAYDPNAYSAADLAAKPVNPSTVVGKAAGGYLDAQSVGQGNQALQQQPQQQNNQLGLASIPNMSQYTNYTNNPGMMSPTQNTDDGGVGGISVLGQTNPMW
jgi:hypothetical protein